jgi:histidinol-phosphate/aromatic aminotransferase/cobyric acid decarboxylase-like protein
VSTLAAKLAVAAINDRAFIKKTLSFIQKERQFLTRELNRLGLTVSNSVTNNLFVEVNNATEVIRELNREGVSVINGTFFPGMTKEGFRISLKDRKTNRLFIKKLTGVLACINKKTLLPSKEDL